MKKSNVIIAAAGVFALSGLAYGILNFNKYVVSSKKVVSKDVDEINERED